MVSFTWVHPRIRAEAPMVNRNSSLLTPQSIGSQSPPVFTNLGMASQFSPRRRPPYRRLGGSLNNYVLRIRRGRCSPRGRLDGSFALESHIVRGVAQAKRSQIIQIGIFVRGIVPWRGGCAMRFGERFGLGDYGRSS